MLPQFPIICSFCAFSYLKVCAKIKELAEKVKVKAEEVDKALKEIIAKGITKIREIIEKIKEKLFPALEDEGMHIFSLLLYFYS